MPEIVPLEFRDKSIQLPRPDELIRYQHPITMTTRHFILSDPFHIMSNPQKSPLCVFHDIDKCRQGITIKTSYQETENSRKNYCHWSAYEQSFVTHFFFTIKMKQVFKGKDNSWSQSCKKERKLFVMHTNAL